MASSNFSSGFGDESPILSHRQTKEVRFFPDNLSLKDLYKRLVQHYKKGKRIPRSELKNYADQIIKMDSDQTVGNSRLRSKISGILSYILKKRSEFHNSLEKGEIEIIKKSTSQPSTAAIRYEIPPPPVFYDQALEDSFSMHPNFLTNNDFNMVVINQESNQMEIEANCNLNSEDLFSTPDPFFDDYNENYHRMLSHLVGGSAIPNMDSQRNDERMDISDALTLSKSQMTVEEDITNSNLVSVNESQKPKDNVFDKDSQYIHGTAPEQKFELIESQNQSVTHNIFDNFTITNKELKQEFDTEFQLVHGWVSDVVNGMAQLKLSENPGFITSEMLEMNESTSSSSSVQLQTYVSGENYGIIKEVCIKFKENLRSAMETDKDLQILKDLIDF